MKTSVGSELVRAIEEVVTGRTYLSPVIAKRFDGRPPLPSPKGRISHDDLTDRQREVLQLMAEGHLSKEIAAILHITMKTVEFHKSTIRRKLHLGGTAEMIKYAIEHKIVVA